VLVLRVATAPRSHVGGPPTRSGHKQSHISTFSTSRHALVLSWSLGYLDVSITNFRDPFARREIGNLVLAVSDPLDVDTQYAVAHKGRTSQTVCGGFIPSSRLGKLCCDNRSQQSQSHTECVAMRLEQIVLWRSAT
jgi:hypothetical protein